MRSTPLASLRMLATALFIASLLGSVAASQTEPSSTQAPTTTLHSNANLVLVDVVVTSKGKPVPGLSKSQFQVTENGRVEAITSFEEHEPPASPEPTTPSRLPPDTHSDALDYPATSPANILLLDALNTPLADQMQARQQMLDYLKTLPPNTPMAIFTLASSLKLVQALTANRSLLSASIKGAEGRPQASTFLDPAADQALNASIGEEQQFGASQQVISTMQQFQADATSMQADRRIHLTLEAMQQLARYSSGIPSRKNLIWFSGSFPLSLDADADLDSPLEATRNYSEELHETSNLLSAARVAVYPVDARGLLTLPMSDANYSPSGTATVAGGAANTTRHATMASGMPGFAKDNLKSMKQTATEHSSMLQVAMETGGWAFFDSNGLQKTVERVVAHGSSYYTIGYTSSAKQMDGKFRTIKVRVAGPGYQVAYRSGYYADDPLKRLPFRSSETSLADAAAHAAPTASELLFTVHVVPSSRPAESSNESAGRKMLSVTAPGRPYAFDFNLDARSLELSALSDGSNRAQVEFIVIAYDKNGRRLNHSDNAFAFHLRSDQYPAAMQQGIPKHLEVTLPPGDIFLRVAVHDLLSNRIGSTEFPLQVKVP